MNRANTVLVFIILLLSLLLPAGYFLYNITAKKKIVEKIDTQIHAIDRNGSFKYDNIKIKGFFKINEIIIDNIDLVLKNNHYKTTKINISDINKNSANITLENIILSANEKLSNQEQLSYTIKTDQKTKISYNQNKLTSYEITLPQLITIETPYSNNLVKFHKEEKINIDLDNNILEKLVHNNQGYIIYEDNSENVIESNIGPSTINIIRQIKDGSFKYNISIINNYADDVEIKNNQKSPLIIDLSYSDNINGKKDILFQINKFQMIYPSSVLNIDGQIKYRPAEITPSGFLNISLTNYKEELENILSNYTENIEKNINIIGPEIKNIIGDPIIFKNNLINFINEINIEKGDDCIVKIIFNKGQLPLINNLLPAQIIQLYKKNFSNNSEEEDFSKLQSPVTDTENNITITE